MNVSSCHTPGDATLQPFSVDLWRRGRPKISSRVYSQWERDAQELAGHLKDHVMSAISKIMSCQNWVSAKSDTQDGRPIKREDPILP